jgi:hypothetical protein
MNKDPIIFKCEDSMWQMLADGTKTWDARRNDLSDDRIYRLLWGKYHERPGRKPSWGPLEDYVTFLNKATGEMLTFRFLGVEFTDWAPGWMFIRLGGRTGRIEK